MLPSDGSEFQSTQPITSPFNPDKWDSARLVPNSTEEWAPTPQHGVDSRNELITTAKSSSFSTHTPPQTALVSGHRTDKTDSAVFSTMRHTNSTQMDTPRSDSRVTNPFSASSSSQVDYPCLKLTRRAVDLIKNDFVERRVTDSLTFEQQEMEMITTVELYHQNLSSSLEDCSRFLDTMIGTRYVFISEAMKSLEQMVGMAVITEQEIALSADCEQIANSSANDVISIHCLSNVVRKILIDRDRK